MPFDYDTTPERYRLGMRIAIDHGSVSLYDRVAQLLRDLEVGVVLDVGCADGVLRRALGSSSPRLVGLDTVPVLLRGHPPPVVRAEAARLPFVDGAFDAVTALNVLYHLADPLPALRAARRVLRRGGHLVAATIARSDSPELARYWRRSATPFDAEDAPRRRRAGLRARHGALVGCASRDPSRLRRRPGLPAQGGRSLPRPRRRRRARSRCRCG